MTSHLSAWQPLTPDVLFIDGPCRGQRMAIQNDRTSVEMSHQPEHERFASSLWDYIYLDRPHVNQTHYHIHRAVERLGIFARVIRFASIESQVDSISKQDFFPVQILMRQIPWSIGPEPSFLYNLDRWIVWAAYKNDAGSRSFRNWVESGGASWKLWTYYRGRYR